MGLFSGLIRLSYLTQEQLNLEYKIQDLSSTKMRVSVQAVELISAGSELDPESPEYRAMEARREKLQLMEKKLDQQLLRYQTLLKAVNTEIESAQKIVDSSIKRFFSYGSSVS